MKLNTRVMTPGRQPAKANEQHQVHTGFQARIPDGASGSRARRGVLKVQGIPLETPALFPVLNFLTGPPSLHRNGATHKFLKRELMFEARRPNFMTEALHFTDYPFTVTNFREWFPHTVCKTDARTLQYWVCDSLEALGLPHRGYRPLFFVDSGGFRLLFNREMDISAFGYEPTQDSMLELQLAYGADIVASLDYPIPPRLESSQISERMEKSVANAVRLMELLYKENRTDATGKRPYPVLAVHGQSPKQIHDYILLLFARLVETRLHDRPFGIGIGSLVPLRTGKQADRIIVIVKAVMDTLNGDEIPEGIDPSHILVHAFGVTGDMIPALAHLGVDTFDSSSYIKSASVLDYYDPDTWTSLDFRALTKLPCHCSVCANISPEQLKELQTVLAGARINGNQARLNKKIGNFTVDIKSDVYGIIAYHNLNLQDHEIEQVRMAIDEGRTATHLVQFSKAHQRSQELVQFIAGIDATVATSLQHVQLNLFPKTPDEIEEHYNDISLLNDPDAFDISKHPDYHVPTGKDRLLLLACSQTKPYRQSKSHTTIQKAIGASAGDRAINSHKVTLSGLYGPVPQEFEDEPAVQGYEYLLSTMAHAQKQLLIRRLVAYIEAHISSYNRIVAFMTARAYREVVEVAFAQVRANHLSQNRDALTVPVPLILVPAKTHGTGVKDLLSHSSISEMFAALYPEIPDPQTHNASILSFPEC